MVARLSNSIWQVLFMLCVVVLFRLMYVDLYQYLQTHFGFQSGDILSLFFQNPWAMIIAFGLDVYLVLKVNEYISYVDNSSRRLWIDLGLGVVVSIVALLPLFWKDLFGGNMADIVWWRIVFTYLTALLVNLVFIGIFDLVVYFHQSNQLLRKAQAKKTEAQYRYGVLKQQLNPHFLFNSLNILDYLVNMGEKERASAFIRKLAAVYRYMLRMETQELVPLVEETEFINQYVDLLSERFPQGLQVQTHIPEDMYHKNIIPLSLQVLIENATKHNVVHATQPLRIDITAADDAICVSNNLQPKLSASSTGVGLDNINQQCQALIGRPLKIFKTDTTFTVILPLA